MYFSEQKIAITNIISAKHSGLSKQVVYQSWMDNLN